jgi:hypothetical protein
VRRTGTMTLVLCLATASAVRGQSSDWRLAVGADLGVVRERIQYTGLREQRSVTGVGLGLDGGRRLVGPLWLELDARAWRRSVEHLTSIFGGLGLRARGGVGVGLHLGLGRLSWGGGDDVTVAEGEAGSIPLARGPATAWRVALDADVAAGPEWAVTPCLEVTATLGDYNRYELGGTLFRRRLSTVRLGITLTRR